MDDSTREPILHPSAATLKDPSLATVTDIRDVEKAQEQRTRKGIPNLLATVGPARVSACAPERHSGPFITRSSRTRYALLLASLATIAVLTTTGILAWNNPLPFGSEGFWRIATMRASAIVVMAVVATCQAFATIAFQTATANRIITPSIMGFESLYVLLHTSAVFFLGAAGVTQLTGTGQFFLMAALMVGFSGLLYGWLLNSKTGSIHVMLLVGIVLGGGLGSFSTFMQRLLDPSDFDILTTRMFGNISNAELTHLPFVIPIVVLAAALLFAYSPRLNVLALGRETATNLGVHHKRATILVLLLVSILMAMTTSLVGPMTFLGFLIAALTYQLTDTYDHRLLFPAAILIGYDVMTLAYFILRHVFNAQGAVTVIIELIGGLAFLLFILRKGRL
ncbi:iron chelate uptake ABC transporter family permease subunit [Dermabacter hominis]|uniref:iron chelate uptake ABC transporter family permease subunit n=1 Tax=Dermabacter hominis TaxID=36740 RepID=UPI0021A3A88D|nr:iron chelate uptake ABC transporter family permease subunit [Dermabacter hominis]MCT1956141.1 iron chelate uptake ABC transporter family permease subunit [Dermabacter hominis]